MERTDSVTTYATSEDRDRDGLVERLPAPYGLVYYEISQQVWCNGDGTTITVNFATAVRIER
jgi:hypothetical protein